MPIILSENIVLGTAVLDSPLSYPRILWQSHFRDGTVIASSEESDEFAADNATLDTGTATFWRPSSLEATLEVQLDAPAATDYAMIAAHTAGTEQATIFGEYFDDSVSPGDWEELFEVLPGSDRVLVALFDEVTARRFRFRLTGTDVPSIGIAMMGKALAMPRGVTLDHGPITLAKRTERLINISGTGAFLGNSIRREGVATRIAFQHLTDSFIRNEFEDFIDHARTKPFGWAWNSDDWPAEVAYVWALDDIHPVHSGLQDRLNVEFDVEGLLD